MCLNLKLECWIQILILLYSLQENLNEIDRRFRFIALLAAALVIVALLISPLLLLRHLSTGGAGEFPTLTLSSNTAKVGQKVLFTLNHVTPSTRVVLTHDSQPIPDKWQSFYHR